MRIIDRYIWKELIAPFFLGLIIGTFLLLIDRIFDMMDLIINKGVPVYLVLNLFAYLLPSILVLTVPIGVLFSILVAFGRLSADMEIVALKACGVSPLRLLWPVLAFGVTATAVTGYLMIDALPRANYAFKSLVFDIVRTTASAGLKERVFNDTFGNFVIYVDEIATDQVGLRNVFVSDERKPDEQRFITAREGRLLSDEVNRRVTLRLLDGAFGDHRGDEDAVSPHHRGRPRQAGDRGLPRHVVGHTPGLGQARVVGSLAHGVGASEGGPIVREAPGAGGGERQRGGEKERRRKTLPVHAHLFWDAEER